MPAPDLDALDPLILPEALLKLIVSEGSSRAELHVVGNNAGIVSLANVLRWLASPATEREALHLSDLPFVWSTATASLAVVRTETLQDSSYGVVRRLKTQTRFEWHVDAMGLPRLADSLNLLAAMGGREGAIYDAPGAWDASVHIRIDDTLDGA